MHLVILKVISATSTLDRPQAASAPAEGLDWPKLARELDSKSPLEIIDHVRHSPDIAPLHCSLVCEP